MIETTKKILQKLINNIEKYQVKYMNFATYHFEYTWENECYSLTIGDEGGIMLQSKHANLLETLTEDDKYEVLSLAQKLSRVCEDCAKSKFKNFANSKETSSVNNIEELD